MSIETKRELGIKLAEDIMSNIISKSVDVVNLLRMSLRLADLVNSDENRD